MFCGLHTVSDNQMVGSFTAHPVPTVSSVAEAADYAALTGRQIEAVELLLEQHKRARAAGTAQGLLPLNVLPERTGGESKCDKRDRNNLVRLLRSIRAHRKVVVADTEFGKRSSRTAEPQDDAWPTESRTGQSHLAYLSLTPHKTTPPKPK